MRENLELSMYIVQEVKVKVMMRLGREVKARKDMCLDSESE